MQIKIKPHKILGKFIAYASKYFPLACSNTRPHGFGETIYHDGDCLRSEAILDSMLFKFLIHVIKNDPASFSLFVILNTSLGIYNEVELLFYCKW